MHHLLTYPLSGEDHEVNPAAVTPNWKIKPKSARHQKAKDCRMWSCLASGTAVAMVERASRPFVLGLQLRLLPPDRIEHDIALARYVIACRGLRVQVDHLAL